MILQSPNRCIVLGIDSGKNSGWGVLFPYYAQNSIVKLAGAGTADTHVKRKNAYEFAVEMARILNLPLIICRETWTPGWSKKKRSIKTILGLGASWGRWETVLEESSFPKSRIFTVTPNTWRQPILGLKPGKYSHDQAKQAAVVAFNSRWGNQITDKVTHDMAEGTLIAYYGLHDSRVADAIKNPRRLRKV